jgi:hypothetical protein
MVDVKATAANATIHARIIAIGRGRSSSTWYSTTCEHSKGATKISQSTVKALAVEHAECAPRKTAIEHGGCMGNGGEQSGAGE